MHMGGFTTEEALKMENETLKEQLKATTDALERANAEITKIKERLKADILRRSNFKEADLEGKTVKDLQLIQTSLDKARATSKSTEVEEDNVMFG
jgi:molecular chaperone GrpE (heat shock protein)